MRKGFRDYGDYVQDIYDAIEEVECFIEGMTFEDFTKDKKNNKCSYKKC